MAVIVIDPGHGGTVEVGGSSPNNAVGPNGTLEKTLTLDVARRLRSSLQARGHQVRMTRDADNNLGLAERAKVAKTAGAPVFVSIHFNGSIGHNAQGTETFVHTTHRPISATLCRAIQPPLVAATGLSDRNAIFGGVKQHALGVLRIDRHAANTACVLVEVSFLDRADEEQRLVNAAYKDRIAAALADGIDAYFAAHPMAAVAFLEGEEFGDAMEVSAAEAGLAVDAAFADLRPNRAASIGAAALPATPDYEQRLDEIVARIAAQASEGAAGAGIDAHEFSEQPIGSGYDASELRNAATARNPLQSSFGGVALADFDYDAFEAFINSLGLEFFSPVEFLFLGGGNQAGTCHGLNRLPPQNLWVNIKNTALMLDEIRRKLDAPVRILSAYRNQPYNSCIGGAATLLGRCAIPDPHFTGGVGYYPNRAFIHVDTRGNVANWTG